MIPVLFPKFLNRTLFEMLSMGRMGRFHCKSCNNEIKMELPSSESPMSFQNKVPCTKCGKVGCNFNNFV